MLSENEPKAGRLPTALLNYTARARRNTYAGGAKEVKRPLIKGFHELRYKEDGLVYRDMYIDFPMRPGNFAGMESMTEDGFDTGEHRVGYSYAGGLTEEGLRFGEGDVYKALQHFLGEHSDKARMGESFTAKNGEWEYINKGEITDWGWMDHELLKRNGILMHEMIGGGINAYTK